MIAFRTVRDEVQWEQYGPMLAAALDTINSPAGRAAPLSMWDATAICEAFIELTHDRIDLENELDRKAALMRIQQRQIGLQARENRRLRGEVARLKRALRWKHDEAVAMVGEIERLREAGS